MFLKPSLAFVVAVLFAAPALAQGPDGTFKTTIINVPHHGEVNVRKQARVGSAVVGKLNEGTETFSNGQCWNSKHKKLFSAYNGIPANTKGIWCAVQTMGGELGWVQIQYLDMSPITG